MKITIFKEVTTEGVITSIEENSKKYHDGLYADMNNLPERTMVKKGAAEIGDIIKQLKTARIAITKANTAAVNKEHDEIIERLLVANKPFTDLLDAYNVERKKILDSEKARKQAIIDLDIFNRDHEMALLTDENEMLRLANKAKEEEERAKQVIIDRDNYAAEQVNLAEERQKQAAIDASTKKTNEENSRLADINHVRSINRAIFISFTNAGLDKEAATLATQALIDSKVPNTIIHY
ncbi:MAG: hypothetical protein JKY81_05755 [Colwellia sp.]|nr:hypothetical protein [Colwellia sp.]